MVIGEGTRSFLEMFNPRSKSYSIWEDKPADGEPGWKWRRGALSEELIERGQRGEEKIAFLGQPIMDYFGLDIDDHVDGGWMGSDPTNVVMEKVREACTRIGVKPCALFRSPRGVHAFWFFDKKLPALVIKGIIEERIEGVAEVLPKARHGMRMPTLMDCLDEGFGPKTARSFTEMGRYGYKEVFGEDAEPASIRKRMKAKAVGGHLKKAAKRSVRLEREELECGAFVNNDTNAMYCRLVGVYFAEGVAEGDAIVRILELARRSPGYEGDLKDRKRVEERVGCSYVNLKKQEDPDERAAKIMRDEGMKRFFEVIVGKLGLAKKTTSRRALEQFICRLAGWIDFIDMKAEDKEWRGYWTYLYPGFAKLFKEGYVPLPSSLMRKWNWHYTTQLKLLVSIGALKPSKYNYSSHGRCKYFEVCPELRKRKPKARV